MVFLINRDPGKMELQPWTILLILIRIAGDTNNGSSLDQSEIHVLEKATMSSVRENITDQLIFG